MFFFGGWMLFKNGLKPHGRTTVTPLHSTIPNHIGKQCVACDLNTTTKLNTFTCIREYRTPVFEFYDIF